MPGSNGAQQTWPNRLAVTQETGWLFQPWAVCTLLSKQPFLTGKRDHVCVLHSVPMIQFFTPVFSPAEDLCLIPLLTRTGAWQKVSTCSAQALATAAVRLPAAGRLVHRLGSPPPLLLLHIMEPLGSTNTITRLTVRGAAHGLGVTEVPPPPDMSWTPG